MKLFTAALAALVTLGFAGAVSAQCASYSKSAVTAEAVVLPPEGSAGS